MICEDYAVKYGNLWTFTQLKPSYTLPSKFLKYVTNSNNTLESDYHNNKYFIAIHHIGTFYLN